MITILLSFLSLLNNRYLSIFIIPFAVVLYFYLIFNFSSLDLSVYSSQLESNQFYQREFVFGALQKLSVSLFDDSYSALKLIQLIYFFLLSLAAFTGRFKCSWLYFFLPVFFLGEFNSLRQGFSAVFLMLALQSNSQKLKIVLLLLSMFSHTSAIIAIPIYYSIFAFNNRFTLKLIIVMVLGGIGLFFVSEILSWLDKSNYIRDETFSSSRYGSDFKSLYLFCIGFFLILERRYKEIQSLGFIFILFSFSILILSSSDMLFRLSYFLQCFLLYFFVFYRRSMCLSISLFILLANPSTFTLIYNGQIN